MPAEMPAGGYRDKKGYKLSDGSAIAECIYAARFITEEQAEKYVDIITRNLVSVHQATKLSTNLFFWRGVEQSISKRKKSGKNKHAPEKISFKCVVAALKGKV